MSHIKIYPSLISADLLNLDNQIKLLEPHCDGFHVDVMDFHFVPNLTWGPAFINAIAGICAKPIFIHLMITNPLAMIPMLKIRAHDYLSFHIETIKNFSELSNIVKEKKTKVSIAIKPKTALSAIFDILPYIDHVLLMSVEPGFSGQQFMPEALDRLKELVNYRTKNNLTFLIGMDGGITADNINQLTQLGANDFGIAQGIFGQSDHLAAIKKIYLAAGYP